MFIFDTDGFYVGTVKIDNFLAMAAWSRGIVSACHQ
jgi:hypothetical protein